MTIPSPGPQQWGPAPGVQWAKRLLGVCAVGCVVAVLAACGGSSPKNPSTSSGSPATSSSAATPASLSQLEKIVLQPADLPSGWTAAPYQPDPNASAEDAFLVKCVGARNTDSDKVAEAHSDHFTLGNAEIDASATSYRSQSDLDTDVAILHSPNVSLCYGQLMKKLFAAAGATTESVSIKITPGSAGGPANVVATGTGTIKVRVNGRQVPEYLTVAYITGPLIEAEVDALDVGTPVPASAVNPLAATVATRAAKG